MVMAETSDALRYSVEVKSRFSLFLNEDISNTDPDVLLRESLRQRAERKKKAKVSCVANGVAEVKKADVVSEPKEVHDATVAKVSPCVPKSPINVQPIQPPEDHSPKEDAVSLPQARGRGAPRGFSRGFRGRFSSARPPFQDVTEAAGDMQIQNDFFRPGGRARGRPRGGFSRGRGMQYTDYREQGRPNNNDLPEHFKRGSFESTPDVPAEFADSTPVPENGDVGHAESEQPVHDQADATVNCEAEGEVEEPRCYTLEEYKAIRLASRPTITLASKGTRKPNDGKDVFANMIAHRKAHDASEESTEEVERKMEEEHHFEINVSFTDSHIDRGRGRGFGGRGFDRGRGFSGPRGGGRARGFRGDNRARGLSRIVPSEVHAPPPVIHSDKDFPSLK